MELVATIGIWFFRLWLAGVVLAVVGLSILLTITRRRRASLPPPDPACERAKPEALTH